MNRRSYLGYLGAVGLVGTAGCLSTDRDSASAGGTPSAEQPQTTTGSDGPSTTAPTPTVATPPPGECEAASPPRPEPSEGLPDPRQYPDRPESIEPTPVQSFLEAYERVYRYNRLLADIAAEDNCLSNLHMSVTESEITNAENGITGEVTTRGSFTGTPCPDQTGTDTETPLPHGDLAYSTARYYVTERFLIRDGVVVSCWE